MKLLVGLGNPGRDYVNTRHNIGFMCLDELARRHGAAFDRVQLRALVASVTLPAATGQGVGALKALLAKPQTFMNASGEAVGALASFYKIAPEEIVVVSDDLDLPFGRLRLRLKGSAGGHNGLRSIMERLGTDAYPRLRVGIGRPPGQKTDRDYVLDRFSAEEAAELPLLCAEVADALELSMRAGFEAAMNRYNVGEPKKGPDQVAPVVEVGGTP